MTVKTFEVTGLKPMDYRILFVRFQREKHSTFVNVLLDGWHLTWFNCDALTEEDFAEACDQFSTSEKYKEAYNKFMGRD